MYHEIRIASFCLTFLYRIQRLRAQLTMQTMPKAADLLSVLVEQLGKESPLPVCKSRARLERRVRRQNHHEFSVPGIRDSASPESKYHVNLICFHVFRSGCGSR
jgi:hypothetical protein